MRHDPSPSSGEPAWPYASLFFVGTFGANDEASKQLGRRSWPVMAFLVAGMILVQVHEIAAIRVAGTAAMIVAVGLLMWMMAVYIRSLDELNRLIQLEAFAWAYGGLFMLVLIAFALAGGGRAGLLVNPIWIFVGEALRGIALVFVARRYR